jgi:hypothetical protein
VYRLMLAVRDAIPQTAPLAKAESAPSVSISSRLARAGPSDFALLACCVTHGSDVDRARD